MQVGRHCIQTRIGLLVGRLVNSGTKDQINIVGDNRGHRRQGLVSRGNIKMPPRGE